MEKFTREYAEKLAEANVDAIGEDFFVDGYMTCLKETNAAELLDALKELVNSNPIHEGYHEKRLKAIELINLHQ